MHLWGTAQTECCSRDAQFGASQFVLPDYKPDATVAGLRPLSTELICPCPSFLSGVVGQSQPSVGGEGTKHVRWPVSKKPMSTKPILLTYISLSFNIRQEKWLCGQRLQANIR